MEVTNLSKTSITEVIDSFLAAFAGYYVKMPTDHSYYAARWKAAGVDFNRSYGMFDEGELIAFIIHAVDNRAGKLTAFNTGTGVIPRHRGKRIVSAIYEYALNDLNQNGIERSTLEVITKNDRAVRAYQSVGFEICKHYQCFAGKVEIETSEGSVLKEIDLADVPWKKLPNQEYYSWDFQQQTILAGKNLFYEVWNNDHLESYFIFDPAKNRIAQFDLLNNIERGWNRLFSAIRQVAGSESVSVINVDDRLAEKVAVLKSVGLAVTVEQFEMEMELG